MSWFNISLPQAIRCCILIMYCTKVILYHVVICPAASHMLLYINHVLQQGNLLSCAYIFLLQTTICVLIINCSEVIFFIRCLHFPAASHTLLCAYPQLQQGNFLSRANIFQLQATQRRHLTKPVHLTFPFSASINESNRRFKKLAEKLN